MKTTLRALLALALAALAVPAFGQTLSQNLPANTVVGRLGAGTSGPAQAIPIATLSANLSFTRMIINGTTDPTRQPFLEFYKPAGTLSNGVSISGAANNGSGLIRLTVSSTAGFATGQYLEVISVLGTTEANGVWAVTVIDSTHLDLQGSTFTNAYTTDGQIGTERWLSGTFITSNVNAGTNLLAANGTQLIINGTSAAGANGTFALVGDVSFYKNAGTASSAYAAILGRGIAHVSPTGTSFLLEGGNFNVAFDSGVVVPTSGGIGGVEVDMAAASGSLAGTTTGRFGYALIAGPTDAAQATDHDAGIYYATTTSNSNTLGWKDGWLLDGRQGKVISATGDIIRVLGTRTIANAFDFTAWTISSSVLAWTCGSTTCSLGGDGGANLTDLTVEKDQNNTTEALIYNNNTGASAIAGIAVKTGTTSSIGYFQVADQGGSPDLYVSGDAAIRAIHIRTNGVDNLIATKAGGIQIGAAPTGADKGAGTLNAASTIYVNNVALASTVSPSFTTPTLGVATGTSLALGGSLTSGQSLTNTGNGSHTGYLRVGSASAPTNTTAGDLTAVRLVIGDGSLAGISGIVRVEGNLTGGTTGYGQYFSPTVQSDVTVAGNGFAAVLNTQATSFTVSNLRYFFASQGTLGAGSTVTTQVGFYAESSMTGATNNYGFECAIAASGTARYCFHSTGTAPNSFAGAILNPGITTDSTHTDATICEDTTTHQFYFGSGAAGICLGTSGRQFKTAFAPMKEGLAELVRLPLYTFRYKRGYGDNGENRQWGTTAQDVDHVLPGVARRNENGELINYDWGALIPISIHAIQQLKADNDNIRHELAELRKKIR